MKQLGFLKRKKVLAPLIGSALILAIVLSILLRPASDAEDDIIWREYQVERGDITASLTGGGTLNATSVQHSFDVELTIKQILVEPGQEVHAGDTLATYSQEAFQEKIDELNGSLETAQRTLADAKNNKLRDSLQRDLENSQSGQSTQAAYESQKRDLENNIQAQERKIAQLQDQLAAYEQELKQVSASQNGTVNSPALQQLKMQLMQLQQELARMENNNTQNNTQEEINTNYQIQKVSDAAVSAAAIKAKQDQISNVQEQINDLSAKEERLSTLNNQIQQTQESIEAAQYDLETQRLSLETLNSDYERQNSQSQQNQQIQNRLDALNTEGLNHAIQNAQDEVDRLRVELAQAQKLLETPVLTAKVDGIVTKVNYMAGETVPSGKSIVTIGNSGEKTVVIQVSQEDIGSIEVGQAVEMQFIASADDTITGHVSDKSLLPTDGGDGVSYKVTIAFEEDHPELMEGMTCGVKFILRKEANVLTLQNKAIVLQNGRQMVTVRLPDGTHEEREITTGFSDGRVSEITGGLSEGDVVVTEG